MKKIIITVLWFVPILLAACQPSTLPASGLPRVLAAESFLAEIAQNVAGDRLQVESLIAPGADPHTYQPIPADLVRLSETQVVILNGAEYEAWLEPMLESASGERLIIVASAGLTPRKAEPHPGEEQPDGQDHLVDPHFWLDPILVVHYVENIRDGLSTADPEGADLYARNADSYIADLRELDAWIAAQVAAIPAKRRLLVTNHDSFGYFADRYGFTIVGTILPGISTNASPSTQQIVQLIDTIHETGAPAIFLETSASPDLANQIAEQTGAQVITNLYAESLTGQGGPVMTYLELMRHNTTLIVEALR